VNNWLEACCLRIAIATIHLGNVNPIIRAVVRRVAQTVSFVAILGRAYWKSEFPVVVREWIPRGQGPVLYGCELIHVICHNLIDVWVPMSTFRSIFKVIKVTFPTYSAHICIDAIAG
jgi:hypothetical protein